MIVLINSLNENWCEIGIIFTNNQGLSGQRNHTVHPTSVISASYVYQILKKTNRLLISFLYPASSEASQFSDKGYSY